MATPQLDDLTGAQSRAALATILCDLEAKARSGGPPFALAMLDLDHLKTVNDVYGHAAGDEAIRTIAMRTMHVLRSEDQLIRYGGDEFVVVLPSTREAEAAAVMRRVRDHVTSDPVHAGSWITVSVSIGVAGSDAVEGDLSGASLLARADERLYAAKRTGRNSVVVQDASESENSELNFGSTRAFGLDAILAEVDAFLVGDAGQAVTRAGRIARVKGSPGAGFSRFLDEVAIRARLTGNSVRHIRGEMTYSSVHLRALEMACTDGASVDSSEAVLTALLRQEAEAHGLLLLVEGSKWLDPASRRVITERLEGRGTRLIEAVPDSDEGTFSHGTTFILPRLGAADTASWLAAAGTGQVSNELAAVLHELGDGLPGRISRLVSGLRAHGVLQTVDGQLCADPDEVRTWAGSRLSDDSGGAVRMRDWEAPLIGRNRFIQSILPEIRPAQLVTLTGPGGVGKSRLAAQLGFELAPDAPDGSTWIDLRAIRSVDQLPRAVADAVGIDSTDDLDVVIAALAGKRHRLVIDEADAIADEAGIFVELLAALPGLRLLITSRMPLRLADEVVIEVPELAAQSAIELFREGMARAGTITEVDDAELEALLTHTGSSPLALEMAAAWTRALTVEELTGVLDSQPELLVEAPGQQPRTTRLIDVTRQLMSRHEQEKLGVLTLIPAGFTAEEAREAAGASRFFLLALLERSLVRREGNRFTVHAAIAERYRAGLQDADAARLQVASTWSGLANRISSMDRGDMTSTGYRIVDVELPNMIMAWQYLLRRRSTDLLWPLAKLLRGYCDVRARRYQALELFTQADLELSDCDDIELRAWIRECLALFTIQLRRTEESRQHIAVALDLITGIETETTALVYNTAGMVSHMQPSGGPDAAIKYFGMAAHLRSLLGDPIGEAQARGNQAYVLADENRPAEARDALLGAVEAYRAMGLKSGLVLAVWRLVAIYRDFELVTAQEVLSLAEEGLTVAEEIGFTHGAKLAAEQLADVLADRSDFAGAALMCERAAHWALLEDGADDEPRLVERADAFREQARRSVAEAAWAD